MERAIVAGEVHDKGASDPRGDASMREEYSIVPFSER
jgi:hypothetical protein